MKRLLILIMVLIASLSFAGDFSGETRVDAVYDDATETTVYAIDAGAVYEAGFLKIGGDVYYDSNEDLDIGIPIALTFGNLILKAEPGTDNIMVDQIYVFDGDIIYTVGVLALSYGFGYGTDEILDMSAAVSITDLIPGVVIDAKWIDAEDLNEDICGDVEVGVTVKY